MNQPKPKRKVSKALVALTLVLAILVTGFGSPGFLLGLITPKVDTKLDRELTTASNLPEREGNSRAIHLEPLSYLTIDAPRDAFYENTEIRFEVLDEETTELYERTLGEIEPNQTILAAYELDAGLGPDDVMPGSYTVSIDLEEAGIPEEYWMGLGAWRVDADGYWSEYATYFDGNNLVVEANQNSILVIVGTTILVGGVLIDETVPTITAVGWRRFFSIEDYIYVYDNDNWRTGKKIFRLKFTYDDTIGQMIQHKKDLEANLTLDPLETKTAYAQQKGIATDNPREDITTIKYPDFKLFMQEYKTQKLLAENQDYAHVTQQLKEAAEHSNFRPDIIVKAAQRLRIAYAYIKDQIKVDMPKSVIDVKLAASVGGGTAAGVTVNHNLFKASYLAISTGLLVDDSAEDWDKMLLTAVHEYYHACQRTYCSSFYSLKVDEAVAQMVEEDAREYFKANGTITTYPACANGSYLEMYGLPINSYSASYPEGSKSCSGSEKSDSGYPLAHFIRFLKDKYNKSYADLCATYKRFWVSPSVSEYLREAFGLSEEALTNQYYLFARTKQAMFYERAKGLYDNLDVSKRWAFPSTAGERSNGFHVQLKDQAYDIRTRHLFCTIPEGYTGDVNMLLVPDTDMAETLPDMKFYSLGGHTTKKVKYGLFFDKAEYYDEYYLLEVDGGTSDTRSTSGYTVWTFVAPEIEENPEIEDGLLKFILPEKSDVADAGYIDGYRVTIKASDGTEVIKHYKISGAGKTISLKVKNLLGRELEEDESVSFTLSICEYIKEQDGSRTYGPESNSRRSMEAAMNETLAQMGAGDGVITISLGWQTPDDLDLHVMTPSGSEIYYGNKSTGGGVLDVDMQVSDIVANPAEHVTFEDPDSGEYRVWVHNYTDRTEDYDTPFLVIIKVGDQSKSYRLNAGSGNTQVDTFTYGRPEGEETGQEYQD